MKIHCQYSELVEVSALKEHPKNSNKHPTDQIERLARILEYQGWRYPVKVSRQTGYVTSGHGRILAAKLNGWREVPVSFQDYDDETQEIADVTSDNAIASWAELDLGTINAFVPDLGPDFDLDLLGIKDFTLDASDKFEGDEDAVPETPIEPKVKRGELWILGEHRLLIDDCTVKENVERLMGGEKADMVYTDPPYGINLDVDYAERYGNANNRNYHTKIAGNYGVDAGVNLKAILNFSKGAKDVFVWGADNYPDCLPRGGSWIVWDKSVEAVDGIASDFELCWSRERHHYSMVRKLWKGAKAREETGQEGDHRTRWGHPTQKPIELALFFFERWGKKTKTVLDFFLGSGTTVIACEKTNRKCFGCEIDEHYSEVIIQRWMKYTGKMAYREDGKSYDEIKNEMP